jgi:hypothetical protein
VSAGVPGTTIELCPRCKREILPRRAVNSLRLDMHRAPAKDMARTVDPRVERHRRLKERKERRRSLRSVTREIGIVGALTVLLHGRDARLTMTDTSDDCPDCLKRQRRAVA